jgi:hypothetical protein
LTVTAIPSLISWDRHCTTTNSSTSRRKNIQEVIPQPNYRINY